MLKCGNLVDCWVCDDGDSGWGGRIMHCLYVFSSFSGSKYGKMGQLVSI